MLYGTLMRGRKLGAICGLDAARGPELRRRLGPRWKLKLRQGRAQRRGSPGPGIPERAVFARRLVSIGGITHRRLLVPPRQAPPVPGR